MFSVFSYISNILNVVLDESYEVPKKKNGGKKFGRKPTAASTANKKKCLPKKVSSLKEQYKLYELLVFTVFLVLKYF